MLQIFRGRFKVGLDMYVNKYYRNFWLAAPYFFLFSLKILYCEQ